jgi:PAS domain S-box-containing protein
MKQKIESIEYSRERYNRLLRFLTDYIYTVKISDGQVAETYHGPGCLTVTGYSSEDYVKDPDLWYRMVYEEDKKAVLEQANKAMGGIDVNPIEHRIIHRDGSTRWVKNSIVLAKNEAGKVNSYDGIIHDITSLKRAEESAALKQKQLIQADKMVSLGILVSGIAHEINNPNNFIMLNAQFFSKVWDDVQPILKEYENAHGDFVIAGMSFSDSYKKIQESLSGITDGANRIQKITRSLTNFAKYDPGELNHNVSLNSVVDNSITIAGNLIKNSTNNFKVNFDKGIPLVTGNAQQLEQVVINLINNSCHALTDKKQAIEISIYYQNDDEKIVLEVKDEGRGIEPENLKYIFDPFFTTKRNTGGTGLGLSISYNIVKNHSGDFVISSKVGKGTTCKVILPIKRN